MLGSVEPILRALNDAGIRYPVVGGVAVVLHGRLRVTAGPDLVVQLEPDNARRAVELRTTHALVLSLDDLIAMKRAVGRPQDLDDAAALEALRDGAAPPDESPSR